MALKQTLEERKAFHVQVNEGFRCVTIDGPDTADAIPINHPIFPLIVTPTVGPTGTAMAQSFYYLASIGVHEELKWPALGAMFGITTGEHGTYGVQHALCNAFYRMMHFLRFDFTHGWLFIPDRIELDVRRYQSRWSIANDAAWEVWTKQ